MRLRRRHLSLTGRLIASLWTAFFIFIAAAEGIIGDEEAEAADGDTGEAIALSVFLLAAAAVCALSWWRPRLAISAFLAIGLIGVALGVVTAGHNHWLAALVAGGPYLLAAFLSTLGRPPAELRDYRP